MAAMVMLVLVAAVGAACQPSVSPVEAAGPFSYPATVTPPIERLAILVTITNRSTDDLQVNPADFLVRDGEHRVYPSNPTATGSDGTLVRLATGPRDGMLPLPTVTLRQAEILSGFVVFDVPDGTRPVELIWRQTDTDQIATLAPPG
ncbi:MAG TPA: DUF4352 domain-containing protein [Chloroflexota bacterium]